MAKRKCFVIGPMNDQHMPHLEWLASQVVGPLLEPLGFEVFTPDADQIGNVMHHVIRSADRSEIVVADTTGNNPNVLYEIAVLDAMGQPCVPVKLVEPGDDDDEAREEELKRREPPKMAFDRAQYRYFILTKGQTEKAKAKMKGVLENALESRARGDMPENPLTDFFGFPLSALSSAHGLTRGYYNNFILEVLQGEVIEGPDELLGAKDLRMECVIPERVVHGTHGMVSQLVKWGKIIRVELDAPGRPIPTHIWSPEICAEAILVDVPTAFGQLYNNITSRLGRNTKVKQDSDEFRELEADEIGQFRRYLENFQNTQAGPQQYRIQNDFTIVGVANCREPALFERP